MRQKRNTAASSSTAVLNARERFVIMLNVQNKACRRTEPLIGFRANIGFLVELLRLVASRKIGMHRPARPVCAVECATVPNMRIENHNRPGGRSEQNIIRLRL